MKLRLQIWWETRCRFLIVSQLRQTLFKNFRKKCFIMLQYFFLAVKSSALGSISQACDVHFFENICNWQTKPSFHTKITSCKRQVNLLNCLSSHFLNQKCFMNKAGVCICIWTPKVGDFSLLKWPEIFLGGIKTCN